MATDEASPSQPEKSLENIESVLEPVVADEKVRQQTAHAILATISASPLPHPGHMAAYENLLPGVTDRLLKMAEMEQAHRHGLDNNEVNANYNLQSEELNIIKRGQIYAFVFGILFMGVATFLFYVGNAVGGGFMSISGLVAIITAFLKNPFDASNHSDPDDKQT
jgi:uncharacterized membrane protein